ncbi:TonB-dependent receptor domain-containing protein [Comamonas sp. J-3]|uniref:TonB-dependent receptor domain-containing protein n=1 Tax=Comamonas trifloxystrobinivorans TaxID=3350256 RepID=UPI0037269B25
MKSHLPLVRLSAPESAVALSTLSFSPRRVALAAALLAAAGAQAQEAASADATEGKTLQEMVVTANRIEQPLSDLTADMSIIDDKTLQRQGPGAIADVLARVPGIQITRNGGPGAATSVFIRGAESRFTAVYVDGVRLDSQSTGGASWQSLPLALIERVEVLRGPAAAVYGSDAMGGVVQIFTKKGEGAPKPYVGFGVGNRGTYTAEAGISGGAGAWDYSLGLNRAQSDGFNARNTATANPDKDGYRNNAINARLGYQINKQQRLEATMLASDMNSGYDTSQQDDRSINKMYALGLNWQSQWTDNYSTKLQFTQSRDYYETRPSPYETDTRLHNYLFQNEWRYGVHTLTAALERREDTLVNGDINRDRSQNALALGYGLHSGAHTVQLNLRRDDDSEFGGKTTGSAAYGYEFAPNWRATATVGTAFRAPTLYQRFSMYGDPSLKPEESKNAELGLRWAQGSNSFSATVYRNNVTELINWVSSTGTCAGNSGPYGGCYSNVGRARLEGITLAGTTKLGQFNLRGSVDFQNPRDRDTDKLLARRAKRFASLGVDTRLAGWDLGADMQATAKRFDNAANTNVLGGYTLFNLSAATQIAKDFSFIARINNLTDKKYETARTYANEGRSFYAGIKWMPQ